MLKYAVFFKNKGKRLLSFLGCILFHHKLDNKEHHQCNNNEIYDGTNKITDKKCYWTRR